MTAGKTLAAEAREPSATTLPGTSGASARPTDRSAIREICADSEGSFGWRRDARGLSRVHNEGGSGRRAGHDGACRIAVLTSYDAPNRRRITGFFQSFRNIWSCPGNTTSIPLYRTVVHVQNGARRQLRAQRVSPAPADRSRSSRVAMTAGHDGLPELQMRPRQEPS